MANSKVFYTADMHFHDKTTFRWDKKNNPDAEAFESVEVKNQAMIDRWNEKVSNKDHVYILGDTFSCSEDNARKILKELSGAKHFIVGNHDRAWIRDIAQTHKYNILECVDYKKLIDADRKVVVSHYPIAFWDDQHEGSFHVYGHVHASREYDAFVEFGNSLVESGILPQFRAFNAGSMLHGYAPVTLDELIASTGIDPVGKKEFKELNKRCGASETDDQESESANDPGDL